MIIYFSGTGNSRYAAEYLGRQLQDPVENSSSFMKQGKSAAFHSDTPWVFVAPVYSWRMPRVFSEFLARCSFSGSRDAYFVLTCGSEMGEAGKYARALCAQLGLRYRGTLAVAMPENLITLFSAPDEARIREMIAAAGPVLDSGASAIAAGQPLPESKCGILDRLKSGPINEGFTRYFLKAEGFFATDKCISCGKCAERCALNNIRMEAGKPVWGNHCTQCMACICRCPAEAIEYGKRTLGKARYYCPAVSE